MFAIPPLLEAPLLVALLVAAVLARRHPAVWVSFLALFASRLFPWGEQVPMLGWNVLSGTLALCVLWLALTVRETRWALAPMALILLSWPFHWSAFDEPGDLPGDEILRAWLSEQRAMGAVAGVAVDGVPRFAAYGRARRFGPAPDENTWYPIDTVARLFTGTALAEDFDRGLIPLATHTAGWPRHEALPGWWTRLALRPTDPWSLATDGEIVAAAQAWDGALAGYNESGVGFCLLGYDLDMAERRIEAARRQPPADTVVAGAYSNLGIALPPWRRSACLGDGGWWSTPAKLLEWAVTDSAAKRVWYEDERHIMGLGWKYRDGAWYEGGATWGHTAFVADNPGAGISVVLLVSGVGHDIEDFGLRWVAELVAARGGTAARGRNAVAEP